MKKYISALFLLGSLGFSSVTSAQEENKNYTVVTGTLNDAEGSQIVLINADNNSEIEHTTIENNTFSLKGEVDPNTVLAVKLTGTDLPLLLVAGTNDTIKVQTALSSFPVGQVEGNKQSQGMQAYQKAFVPMIKQAAEINKKVRALGEGDEKKMNDLQNEAQEFNEKLSKIGAEFITDHPDDLASIFVLMNAINNTPAEELKELYTQLSPELKASDYGKMAKMNISRISATAVGSDAPNFTQNDIEGNPIGLSSFNGQYVLVDFWASWCAPCRRENPNVVRVYKKFKDKNFTILGVSLDRSEVSWGRAIEQDSLTWNQVSDLKGWENAVAQLYQVYSIPANFLIDPEGKIVAKNLRGEALEETLTKLIKD